LDRFVRACGVAAAAIGCLVAASYSTPLAASQFDSQPAIHYLAHASATAEEGAAFDSATANLTHAQTAAAVANHFLSVADAAVPRPRTLTELVSAYQATELSDSEQDCLASAVYFEARGERIEGQLAVAEVVLNRVASKHYPDTICEVVEQPWQFSFVNATGRIPEADRTSKSWKNAVAISTIALDKLAGEVSKDVLWYHADYVAPVWRKSLDREKKVGLHIFYS
jgi:spore germination cell wall hydrolase CwlJ-like protein